MKIEMSFDGEFNGFTFDSKYLYSYFDLLDALNIPKEYLNVGLDKIPDNILAPGILELEFDFFNDYFNYERCCKLSDFNMEIFDIKDDIINHTKYRIYQDMTDSNLILDMVEALDYVSKNYEIVFKKDALDYAKGIMNIKEIPEYYNLDEQVLIDMVFTDWSHFSQIDPNNRLNDNSYYIIEK